MSKLIEICAYKNLSYYDNCQSCSGFDQSRLCYLTSDQLTQHLEGFRLMFHPQVQRFYRRYGLQWKSKN